MIDFLSIFFQILADKFSHFAGKFGFVVDKALVYGDEAKIVIYFQGLCAEAIVIACPVFTVDKVVLAKYKIVVVENLDEDFFGVGVVVFDEIVGLGFKHFLGARPIDVFKVPCRIASVF